MGILDIHVHYGFTYSVNYDFLPDGLLFRKTPKEINYVYGYRTKRSMMNEETWRFANQYFGKAWYL